MPDVALPVVEEPDDEPATRTPADPFARVVRAVPNPDCEYRSTACGCWLVVVRCPHCRREHTHGTCHGEPEDGLLHRGAHCRGRGSNGSYWIQWNPRLWEVAS
ncbi:hypothetical protein [Nostocoides japonicum]|uniref:hypothetical protein n=1 Tax=Nostocoides japonicum TaxID=99481 RepID=UPI0012FAB226|nr:hypothetical protein [Tetrasphaera japonica]